VANIQTQRLSAPSISI